MIEAINGRKTRLGADRRGVISEGGRNAIKDNVVAFKDKLVKACHQVIVRVRLISMRSIAIIFIIHILGEVV